MKGIAKYLESVRWAPFWLLREKFQLTEGELINALADLVEEKRDDVRIYRDIIHVH